MLILTSLKSSGVCYGLLPNVTYSVGRQGTDFVFADSSVSRKHADLAVLSDSVTVSDLNSKYGTYVGRNATQANSDNSQDLRIRADTVVRPGQNIRFGLLASLFKLDEIKLVICSSGLPKVDAMDVARAVQQLGNSASISETWSDDVTHLVVRDGKLTIKVTNALAKCVPIVTVSFLLDFVKCLQSKQVLPDPTNYTPVIKESFINSSELKLAINPARRSVFKGKTFAFGSPNQTEKYRAAIVYGGGRVIGVNDASFIPSMFSNPNNLLIAPSNDVDDTKWKSAVANVQNAGFSLIPEQHIALAILITSCNNHCNPEYKARVRRSQQSSLPATQQSTLAPETQMLEQSEILTSLTGSTAAIPETARTSMASSTSSTYSDGPQVVEVKSEPPDDYFRRPTSPTKIGPTPTQQSQSASALRTQETSSKVRPTRTLKSQPNSHTVAQEPPTKIGPTPTQQSQVPSGTQEGPTKIGPTQESQSLARSQGNPTENGPTRISQRSQSRIQETIDDDSDDDDIFGFEEQETTKKRKHSEEPEPVPNKRPRPQEAAKVVNSSDVAGKENTQRPPTLSGFMGKTLHSVTVKSEPSIPDDELSRSFITMEIRPLVVSNVKKTREAPQNSFNATAMGRNLKKFKKQPISRTARPISCSFINSTSSSSVMADPVEIADENDNENEVEFREAEDFWNFESQKSSISSSKKRKR